MQMCSRLTLILVSASSVQKDFVAAVNIHAVADSRRVGLSLSDNNGRKLGSRAGGQDDDLPTCSCDCCDVSPRRPDEFSFGAVIKCAPSEQQHSTDVCQQQCTPVSEDPVLGEMATEGTLDMQRFCMFECKPAGGITSRLATQCVALNEVEESRVVGKDGNVKDPAFLYSRPAGFRTAALRGGPAAIPSNIPRGMAPRNGGSSLLSGTASVSSSGSADGASAKSSTSGQVEHVQPTPEAFAHRAHEAIIMGPPATATVPGAASVRRWDAVEDFERGSYLAEDEGEETVDATNDAIQSEIAMRSDPGHFAGDPFATTADISNSAIQAGRYARGAGKAAATAEAALKEAQSKNWHIALSTAQTQVLNVENTVRAEDLARAMALAARQNKSAPGIDWQWQEAIIGAKQVAAEYQDRAQQAELAAQQASNPSEAAEATKEAQQMYLGANKAKVLIPVYEDTGRRVAAAKAAAAQQALITAAATAAFKRAAAGLPPLGPPAGVVPMGVQPMVPMPPRVVPYGSAAMTR